MDTTTRPSIPATQVSAHLAELAGLLDDRDRRMGRAVRLLVSLQADDRLHDELDGVTLQVWLEHVGRLRAADARALLGAVDALARMPAVVGGLGDRWLSWTQVQAICRAARDVPVARLAELDRLVAGAMVDHADWEPDALVQDVWDWVDRIQPSRLEREERAAERGDVLVMSPRLTGGGSFYGEYGPVGFATLAEAVAAPLAPPPALPDDLDPDAVAAAYQTLDEQRAALTRGHGQAMAQRLLAICQDSLSGSASNDGGEDREARPLVLAVTDLEALLDQDRTPGWLLHTLAGGRMKLSTSALQRLVDERGADLETIVLDQVGQVVGVGHQSYVAPGWLRRAIWARDLAVRDPDGSCPIRRADLDHEVAWPDGTTDVSNLAPLGRRWHNLKTTRRWTVTRARDGTVTWTHRRHGWRLKLAPPRRDLAHPPATGPPRLPLDLDGLDQPGDPPAAEAA